MLKLLLAVVRFPVDLLMLSWDYLRLVAWSVLRSSRRAPGQTCPLQGVRRQLDRQTREVDGREVQVCLCVRRYGNPWLFRLVFGWSRRAPEGEAAAEHVCGLSEAYTTSPSRWVAMTVVVFGLWAAVAACVVRGTATGGGDVQATQARRLDQDLSAGQLAARRYALNARNLFGEGKLAEARLEFKNAIQRDPDYVHAYVGLGECNLRLGRFEEAKASLEKALDMQGAPPETHGLLAGLAARTGDLPTALAHARKARDANVGDPGVHLLLSALLQAKGETAAALREAEIAAELDPQNPRAHLTAAAIHLLQGALDPAETSYRKALELAGEDVDARLGLARVMRERGDFPGAIAELEAAVRVAPDHPLAVGTLSEYYALRGDWVTAIDI